MKIDELAKYCEIERAAGLHRRGDRHQAASEHENRVRKIRILPEYPPPEASPCPNSMRKCRRPRARASHRSDALNDRWPVATRRQYLFECDDRQTHTCKP